jgi:hypothetical protein
LENQKHSNERQLRAYVGFAPGDVEDFGIAAKQRVRFGRKNYGLTPAYNVGQSTVGFSIIKQGDNVDTSKEDSCGSPKIQGLVTMFPSADLPWTVTIDPKLFDSQLVQLVKTGDRLFVYWGNVCYHDTFGNPHYTNYCWMYKCSGI